MTTPQPWLLLTSSEEVIDKGPHRIYIHTRRGVNALEYFQFRRVFQVDGTPKGRATFKLVLSLVEKMKAAMADPAWTPNPAYWEKVQIEEIVQETSPEWEHWDANS